MDKKQRFEFATETTSYQVPWDGWTKQQRLEFATEDTLSELAEVLVPLSTSNNTKWALKNFSEWKKQRKSKHPIASYLD